ncbi:polycystic kidney disease protein 1-like 2 isoform X2 [Gigantopelta aegis]|uniref:polycystic kidney disease protein 1-like 2 isoform X2 n=1 Tax=Gigantopelta aegis TaxID=1735272 RepID=UPI001B8893C3|nr:polycystic kidney disease protein 1-like 2 isoform X2 [Gigantopelta aegis]
MFQSVPESATYYEFFPEKMYFTKATETCRAYGGNLASIHTISEHRLMYSNLSSHHTCTKWLLGLKGKSLMHSAWLDGSWVDFALFEGTVPEHTNEDQVVFMDKDLFYMWKYGPVSTTQGCVVCQYRQNDCSLPVLNGYWTIPRSAWTASGDILQNTNIDYVVLNLANGLNFFKATEPKGYIQIDIQQEFLLHSLKCSSLHGDILEGYGRSGQIPLSYAFYIEYSVDLLKRFVYIKDQKNQKLKFSCGSDALIVKSTHLSSPVIARFVKISWKFNTDMIVFTLAMELFGCPAYTSAEVVVNLQCGTEPSLYSLMGNESFRCLHHRCPLTVDTCGPYKHYYVPNDRDKKHTCSPSDTCASMPCDDGTICLDYGKRFECHCPHTVEGDCKHDSDMYIMVDKRQVVVDEILTFYLMVKNPISQSTYQVQIAEDVSCTPSFTSVNNSKKGQYLCSTAKYYATKGGTFEATVKNIVKGGVMSSNTVEFRVIYPDSVVNECLAHIKISGVSHNIQSAYLYHRGQDLKFTVSATTVCSNLSAETFKIMEYEWTFSQYRYKSDEHCHSDADLVKVKIAGLKPSGKGDLLLPKRTLPLGYFSVCLKVKWAQTRKTNYSKETCGFFKMIVAPLTAVVVPTTAYQSIPNNQPVILNASASLDPNSGDSSGIIYEWYCRMKKTNDSCAFASRLQAEFVPDKPHIMPVTESVLIIPKLYLVMNRTYVLTVVISKDSVPSSSASVTIHSSSSTAPDFSIRCVYNCGEVVAPAKLLALEMDCENCGSDDVRLMKQMWKLSSQKDGVIPFSVWVPKSLTGNRKKSLVLQAGTLNISNVYQFEVEGHAKNNMVGTAVYKFVTNSPPRGRSCFITPASGRALVTHFTVTCSGYHDPHTPLMYTIYLKQKGLSDTLLYHGYESTIRFITLPEGSEELGFKQTLIVSISDSFETSTDYPISVQVRSPQDGKLNTVKLLSDITKNLNLHQDTQGFLRQAKNVLEMLGKESKKKTIIPNEEKKQKAEIRERVMDSLQSVKIKDKETLFQISDLVADIVSQEDNMSANMEELAMNVITHLTDALMDISKSSPTVARIIAKKQCEALFSLMDISDEVDTIVQNQTKENNPVTSTESTDTQQEKSKSKVKHLLTMFEKVGDAMLVSVQSVDEESLMVSEQRQMTMLVEWSKVDVDDIHLAVGLKHSSDDGSASFTLPMANTFNTYNQQRNASVKSVNLQVLFLKKNPFLWSSTAKRINLPVMMILLKEREETQTLALSNFSRPADIFIPLDIPTQLTDNYTHLFIVSHDAINKTVLWSTALNFTIPSADKKMNILKIVPINTTLKLHVFWGTADSDIGVNHTESSGSDWPIPDGNLLTYKNHKQDPQLLFLPKNILGVNDTNFYVRVQVQLGQIVDIKTNETTNFQVEVGIQLFTAECSYWDEDLEEWRQDGCKVGPVTTLLSLHCQCDHLTGFSGGVFVAPNPVHPIKDVPLFLTFFDNPLVISLMICVWIMYLQLLSWAHKVDYKDSQKTGVVVLADNRLKDHYMYLICVVTSWWLHAGTTSRVFMYLCGSDGDSSPHALYDRERHLFTSGAENWFLLKTRDCLGKIKSVVIWHDNSGNNPSWYLKEVVIKDVQTKQTWHCLYDKWLRICREYKLIHADIPAIEGETFSNRHLYHFSQTMSQGVRNEHLLLSIFVKMPANLFTRKQRLTCALCLVVLIMLANIMYHGIPRDDREVQIDFGPFQFSLVNLVIGIQSAVMVVPVSMGIVLLFMSVEPRPMAATKLEGIDVTSNKIRQMLAKEKKWSCCRLPWYFVYFAYFIAIGTSIICSYFVMLYGLKYGFNKSIAWLVSFFMSFFQSALVIQPVLVFIWAFLQTVLFNQRVKYESGIAKTSLLDKNEEYLDQESLEREVAPQDEPTEVLGPYVPPLPESILQRLHKRIVLNQMTWEVLLQIIMYLTFVAVALLALLGHSDVNKSYHVTKSIHDVFIGASYGDHDVPFHQVADWKSMWEYMNVTFLSNMTPGPNHSISNSVAYLVGRAMLRQIRVYKQDTCINIFETKQRQKAFQSCTEPFSYSSEETRTYNENWKSETTVNGSSMWSYQPARQLDTLLTMGKLAIYPGGGYVVQLPRNVSLARECLDDIQQKAWIDEYTRAVFVEFTLFNPNVQTFSMVILMFEISNTGFVITDHQIYTADFYYYQSDFEKFVAACQIVFVLYLLLFTYLEIKKCCKLTCYQYFRNSWSFVEITILVLGYSFVGLSIYRFLVCAHLMDAFRDSNYEKFVSFNTAAFLDSLITHVMATLNLFIIIKLGILLHLNWRISMLIQTIQLARRKLVVYSFYLFVFTFAYALFGVLVFGTILRGYRNLYTTVTSMLLFMIGKSDYYGLKEANSVLGPVFFFLFAVTFQFVLEYFFLILLMEALHDIKSHTKKFRKEVNLFKHTLKKFNLQ